nr:MFS transporter [Galbitalea soli]
MVTLGAFALCFLAAFENLAVTTVMPTISRELNGAELYAVAFAGPLALGVVGMVVAGAWSDRTGPRTPLISAAVLFLLGIAVAGAAPTMAWLVVGRLLYGMAGGAVTVTLYVVVARAYPEELRPRMFGGFAAMWILPALVGPAIAGAVASAVGWRWVFFGVLALVVAATGMIVPATRGIRRSDSDAGWQPARIAWSVVLAIAVLALSLSSQVGGLATPAVALVAIVLVAIAVRPLIPPGTLRSRRGLPSVVLTRAAVSGAYFGGEIYLPYLFTVRDGLSPALAGLSLTGAGVAWGLTSLWQGRRGASSDPRAGIRWGALAVLVSLATGLLTVALGLPPWVAIAGWTIGGAGMGACWPRLAVLALGYSAPEEQGFTSSALAIADAIGPGVVLATVGIVFDAVRPADTLLAFALVFAASVLVAALGIVVSARVRPRETAGRLVP